MRHPDRQDDDGGERGAEKGKKQLRISKIRKCKNDTIYYTLLHGRGFTAASKHKEEGRKESLHQSICCQTPLSSSLHEKQQKIFLQVLVELREFCTAFMCTPTSPSDTRDSRVCTSTFPDFKTDRMAGSLSQDSGERGWAKDNKVLLWRFTEPQKR